MPPVVEMTRAEYEAKYGPIPAPNEPLISPESAPNRPVVEMTRAEYEAKYGVLPGAPQPPGVLESLATGLKSGAIYQGYVAEPSPGLPAPTPGEIAYANAVRTKQMTPEAQAYIAEQEAKQPGIAARLAQSIGSFVGTAPEFTLGAIPGFVAGGPPGAMVGGMATVGGTQAAATGGDALDVTKGTAIGAAEGALQAATMGVGGKVATKVAGEAFKTAAPVAGRFAGGVIGGGMAPAVRGEMPSVQSFTDAAVMSLAFEAAPLARSAYMKRLKAGEVAQQAAQAEAQKLLPAPPIEVRSPEAQAAWHMSQVNEQRFRETGSAIPFVRVLPETIDTAREYGQLPGSPVFKPTARLDTQAVAGPEVLRGQSSMTIDPLASNPIPGSTPSPVASANSPSRPVLDADGMLVKGSATATPAGEMRGIANIPGAGQLPAVEQMPGRLARPFVPNPRAPKQITYSTIIPPAPDARAAGPLTEGAAPPERFSTIIEKRLAPFDPVFEAAAAETGVPKDLLRTVAATESGGATKAVSPKGAKGIMQFMDATARQYGIDPLDPQQAIPAAARMLKERIEARGGDVDLALADYNFGQGNVNKALEKAGGDKAAAIEAMPAETQNYIKKVRSKLPVSGETDADGWTFNKGKGFSKNIEGVDVEIRTDKNAVPDDRYEAVAGGEPIGRFAKVEDAKQYAQQEILARKEVVPGEEGMQGQRRQEEVVPRETGYEFGDAVEYTGEVDKDGFRKFIWTEGRRKGQEGVALTPEKRAENIARSQAEYRQQQEDFSRLAKAQTPQKAKTLTGNADDDARLMRLREKAKSGRGMTAGDELSLRLNEARASADPSKWAPGDGVGWRVGKQTNRGFRIVSVDPETKTARLRQVADTGLTESGGNEPLRGDQVVHVADLVRDNKYKALATQEAPGVADVASASTIETDPARRQEIKNSISEGKMILQSGRTATGRKMSADELAAVERSVKNSEGKLGPTALEQRRANIEKRRLGKTMSEMDNADNAKAVEGLVGKKPTVAEAQAVVESKLPGYEAPVDVPPISQAKAKEVLSTARVGGEKVSPKTGLTKTQTQVLSDGLKAAAEKLPSEADLDKFPLNNKMPKSLPNEQFEVIEVPGDGKFKVVSKEAASALHKRVTGEPIEGVAPTESLGRNASTSKGYARSGAPQDPAKRSKYGVDPERDFYLEQDAKNPAPKRKGKSPSDPQAGFVNLGALAAVPPRLKKIYQKYFTSRGDMPEEAFSLRNRMTGERGEMQNQANRLIADYGRAMKSVYGGKEPPAKVKQLLSDVLDGNEPDSSLPKAAVDATLKFRENIDQLSRRMVDEGLVSDDMAKIIRANEGEYVRRTYKIDRDADYIENIDPRVRANYKNYLRKEEPGLSDAQLDQRINAMLEERRSGDSPFAPSGTGVSKDLSLFKKRTNIPKELRELYGEDRDPKVRYVQSITTMSDFIAKQRFLTDVRKAGMGKFFFEENDANIDPRASVKIAADTNKSLAPLNGLYTYPEVAEALKQSMEPKSSHKILETYMKANAVAKYSKVVLSPKSQIRQILGNNMFLVANGHNPLQRETLRGIRTAKQHFQNTGTPEAQAYINKLVRLQVLDDSASAGELSAVLRDARLGDSAVAQTPAKLYQFGDNWQRVTLFELEREQYKKAYPDWSDAKLDQFAAEIVANQSPTYSRASQAVRDFRRFPLVGPFATFSAEIIRTSKNIVKQTRAELKSDNPEVRKIAGKRIAGMMTAGSISVGGATASMMALGVSRQDDKDLRKFAAPWMQNGNWIYTDIGEDGKVRIIDTSYTDPYAYISKIVMAGLNGDDVSDAVVDMGKELLGPFGQEQLLTSALMDVARNQTESGKEIYSETDSPAEAAGKIAKRLYEAFEPGGLTDLKRIERGLSGKGTDSGRPINPYTEMAGVATGQRVQEIDPLYSLQFKAREFQRNLSDATSKFSSVARRPDAQTADDLMDAKESASEARKRAFDEIMEMADAAERLGIPRRKIVMTLKKAGVSTENIGRVLHNKPGDFRPPKDLYQNKAVRDVMRPKGS